MGGRSYTGAQALLVEEERQKKRAVGVVGGGGKSKRERGSLGRYAHNRKVGQDGERKWVRDKIPPPNQRQKLSKLGPSTWSTDGVTQDA